MFLKRSWNALGKSQYGSIIHPRLLAMLAACDVSDNDIQQLVDDLNACAKRCELMIKIRPRERFKLAALHNRELPRLARRELQKLVGDRTRVHCCACCAIVVGDNRCWRCDR